MNQGGRTIRQAAQAAPFERVKDQASPFRRLNVFGGYTAAAEGTSLYSVLPCISIQLQPPVHTRRLYLSTSFLVPFSVFRYRGTFFKRPILSSAPSVLHHHHVLALNIHIRHRSLHLQFCRIRVSSHQAAAHSFAFRSIAHYLSQIKVGRRPSIPCLAFACLPLAAAVHLRRELMHLARCCHLPANSLVSPSTHTHRSPFVALSTTRLFCRSISLPSITCIAHTRARPQINTHARHIGA